MPATLRLTLPNVDDATARSLVRAWGGFCDAVVRARKDGLNGNVAFRLNLVAGRPVKAWEVAELQHLGARCWSVGDAGDPS